MKTERIEIIPISDDDERIENLIHSSPDATNMSEIHLYPQNTPTEMSFAIIHNSEFIGYIKLTRIRWFNRKCELSIMIDKLHQGKGLGSEALKTVIDYAFGKMNLHRLEAEVIEFNKASIKLMENFGFVKEGVLREAKYHNSKYYNIYRYGLLRNEWKKGGGSE